MTSAVISPDSKDTTPSLTVTVNRLSVSSSPFPSPGSPFFPPPILSPHEYAVMSSTSKRRSTDSRMNAGSNGHESAPPSVHQNHPAATTVTAAGVAVGKPSGATTTESQDRKPAAGDDKENKGIDHRGRGADVTCRSNVNLNGGVGASPPPVPASTAALLSESVLKPGSPTQPPSATVPPGVGSNGVVQAVDDDGVPLSESSPTTPLASNQNPPTTIIQPSSPPSTSSSTVPTDPTDLRSSRNSLTSSRPAPPSPAISRRTSAALSRRSSRRSRPSSTSAFSAALANPHGEPDVDADPTTSANLSAQSPTTPTPAQPQLQQQQQARKASPLVPAASVLVKIRDFAFPDEDVRHTGAGPLTPRPNRRLQRPLSTWSASSTSSTSSNDDGDDPANSSGGSSYGFAGWGLGRLSWFGVRSGAGATADGGGSGGLGGPSQGDFERNFEDAVSPSYEIDDPYGSLDDDDDFDDYEDDDGRAGDQVGDGEDDVERPLLPGLYRALYAFEPEGTAEMALEEDQIVRVVGRGGGVGWAIVARGGDEGHALVPEGYLELVSLDREQVGEEDG
ncbi:hypothetical protein BJY52DRAFT_620359 [Lactarius psammicola]|nr:hypothetical protein BJY52DRAFT_620359 [Lactarius psammicola]